MKVLTLIPFPILKHGVLQILQQKNAIETIDFSEDSIIPADNKNDAASSTILLLGIGNETEDEVLSLCKKMMQWQPQAHIVLLCPVINLLMIKKYFKLGIKGILLHSVSEQELLSALEKVANGDIHLDMVLKESLSIDQIMPKKKQSNSNGLTKREKEVLNLIVEEYTTKEIAQELFVSDCTIETHRLNLISKLGVKNTAGLVREAFVHHLYCPLSESL